MAVWQFPVVLVPRSAWHALSQKPKMPILDGTAALWESQSADAWTQRLAHVLGAPKPRETDGITVWGDHARHCLQLSLADDGTIEGLLLRVDLRTTDRELADRVLELARATDLLLLGSSGNPIEPTNEAFAAAATSSPAANYVRQSHP